ncbi:hypothetical protein CPC16_006988 [Podila verticillata]|nr:hypothetical protein CPC16_006988 [Podila verticillata]KAI9235266.1 MAG: hypothetical protein BYD32DRAFT_421521 [Podila humilis]KFH69796.1 hypothetical protein MVEG_04601 [Podila verticillata NRRL 6337]
MRFSVVAIVAAVVAVASAQELNPLYPFKANGPCVDKCLVDVGNKMLPGVFTEDPSNPNFMKSLALAHERNTPAYTAYMTETGMCLSKCPADEQALYQSQYQAKTNWYQSHKANGTETSPDSTATPTGGAGAGSGASTLKMSGMVGAAALMGAVVLF